MNRKEGAWKDRLPDDVTCIRCLEVRSVHQLDRLLWCEECLERARTRATWYGWASGAGLAVVLCLWIWFVIQPDLSLIPSAWVATVAVAFYLGGRVARELIYGSMRWQNRRAVEARPPTAPPPAGD